MSPDLINGLFEAIGGLTIWANVRQLYLDKQLKGIRVSSTVFFTTWGAWNLYYYPSLDQWWSFAGGIVIATANIAWVSLAIYYRRQVWLFRRFCLAAGSPLKLSASLSASVPPSPPSA